MRRRGSHGTHETLTAATRYVFVDECGMQTNMTPRYARAPRGQRAVGVVPRNHHKNTTLIAAINAQGVGTCVTLEGATDADAFVAYLAHFLLPSLPPGQVVVLDNLSVHKDKRVAPLIAAALPSVLPPCLLPRFQPDRVRVQ